MKILVLTPFLPFGDASYGGGQIRIRELFTRLAGRHEIHVVALTRLEGPGAAIRVFREGDIQVTAVPHRPARMSAAALALFRNASFHAQLARSREFEGVVRRWADETYDLVQCEFPWMAQYAPGPEGPPFVLSEHNVEFRLGETIGSTVHGLRAVGYKLYSRREVRLRRRLELNACRAAAHVVVVSEPDRQLLLHELPSLQVSVVPNGVDLDYFRPSYESEMEQSESSAVFVGKMDYRPNIDGVSWFCHEVLPSVRDRIPGFTFGIIGANPPPAVSALASIGGVHVSGSVADVRPFLRQATVVVVPLRAGSGTRLKILEAFAAGKAVVSTAVGCEGLDADDGTHLSVADSPDLFAQRVIDLVLHPGRRVDLGTAARMLVEERYGWDAVAKRLEGVYLAPSLSGATLHRQEEAGTIAL